MSHEIMNHDRIALAQTGAWHNLGTVVPADMTPKQAIETYLGWQVDTREIYFRNAAGEFTLVPDKRVTVRSDLELPLGVVSDSYAVIQNREMLEDIEALCGEAGAKVHTIGSVKNCKKVWVLLKLDEQSEILGDKFADYLALMTSHDGLGGYVIAPTSVRIVCNNTYTAAFGQNEGAAKAITIRHTAGARDKIAETRAVLGKVKVSFDQFRDTLTALGGNNITEAAAKFLVEHMVPNYSKRAENMRDEIIELWKSPRGGLTRAVRGTALGLYNAVTEYVDYRKHVKANGRPVAVARAEGALMGQGQKLRADALSVIAEAMRNKELAAAMADDSVEPELVKSMLEAASN